jgi:hypothetical protein
MFFPENERLCVLVTNSAMCDGGIRLAHRAVPFLGRLAQQPSFSLWSGSCRHSRPAEQTQQYLSAPEEQLTDAITQQENSATTIEVAAVSPYKLTYANIPGDSLSDFLTRPRVVSTLTWAVGSPFSYVLQPWYLFFTNEEVEKKLHGFSRFRGQLKLQFLVNGSSFHRGMAFASYLPLSQESTTSACNFNDGIIATVKASGIGSPNGAAYHTFAPTALGLNALGARKLVPISQRQHIKIYPNTNVGGTMTLPFIFPHEYVPVDANFTASTGTSVTTTTIDMGELRIDSVGNLTFLGSNAPDAVDITILMSLEPGYELAGPTVYLQSGESHGSSKIHVKAPKSPKSDSWMGMVKTYGPTIARVLGFTNPPLITDVNTVRIQNAPNLSNSQLSTRDEVLALHPETTLSSLNESLGGSESDMLLSNLAQKESFLTAVDWKATGATSTTNTVLFTSYVHPCISPTFVRTGAFSSFYDQVVPLPMDWIAQTCRCWSGDIIYGFEVITTPFQKGRLKVSFEPSGSFGAVTDSLGINFTKVLDISEGTKFEFRVPYMATTPWLLSDHTDPEVRPVSNTNYTHVTPSSLDYPVETMVKYNPRTMNGIIRMQILNTLTNDLDATIVVTVRAAENFKYAVPCAIDDRVSLQDQYFLQSGEDEYIGEQVVSLRDICHRSTPCGFFRNQNSQLYMVRMPVTGVPRGVGLNCGDSQLKTLGTTYGLGSLAQHSFFQWFSSGFSCARSSHRVTLGGIGTCRPNSNALNDLVAVDRGINKITINSFATDSTYPSLKHRLAEVCLCSLGEFSTACWFGNWATLLRPANGASLSDAKGGSVHVPYQSIVKFQPSNVYYDYYRLVNGVSSGSLIGEPIYTAGTGPVHNGGLLLALASFFYPVDAINVLTNSDARLGGTSLMYTSAGADMAFGSFCNAPTFFRARRSNTFSYGNTDALNTIVNSKLNITYSSISTIPL